MGLILDSSVVMAAERRGETVEQLIQRVLDVTGDQEAALSAIGLAELVHGIYRADTAERRARRESFQGRIEADGRGSHARGRRRNRDRAAAHRESAAIGSASQMRCALAEYGSGPFAVSVRTTVGFLDQLLPEKFSGSKGPSRGWFAPPC